MSVFVFGMGYSARGSVRPLRAALGTNLDIAGTVRSEEKAATLSLAKVKGHVFTGEAPGATLAGDLLAASHVIHSIAPGPTGDAVMIHHGADLRASDALEWLCYLSTVGVYGNFDGAWIDESAPCDPQNRRSQWRLNAEQGWRAFAAQQGIPLCILRLAGIYGPGRSAFDKLSQGTARRIVKPGQVFNRIHVADIGRVIALAARAKLDGTFNLADDEPAPPQQVVAHAAELAGVPPPPEVAFADAEMTPMARSFYADNKRVSNAAIKRALRIELLYPSYRQGLAAILAGA